MKARTAFPLLIGTLTAGTLIFIATCIQCGNDLSFVTLIDAQRRTPLLWMIDLCAMAMIAAAWWYTAMLEQFRVTLDLHTDSHAEQLDRMIARTLEAEQLCDSQSQRIEQLEAELARYHQDPPRSLEMPKSDRSAWRNQRVRDEWSDVAMPLGWRPSAAPAHGDALSIDRMTSGSAPDDAVSGGPVDSSGCAAVRHTDAAESAVASETPPASDSAPLGRTVRPADA